ncbi:uncharacterized protein LOC142554678 [Primulina tabacum]|uniref:uncharacterized protein LOC142554678 n=1 Tax=Primulina tabacum TaxID=48773 RepID=UPI003F59EB99
MLVKASRIWWEATKVTVNVQELKWNEFKDLFYAKYFSSEVKAKKVKEFLELRQDALSVTEYTLKFEEGCVFVPFIAENDKDKGEHFFRGLKPEIRRDVHVYKVVTYQDIVERALLAEHDEQEIEKERQLRRQTFQARGQGTSANIRGGHKGKGKIEQRSKPPVPFSDTERQVCLKCGKPHKGECLVGSGRCFRCKEMGHTALKCPLSSGKGKFQGRIFAMTKESVNPDSSVISGNILVYGKEAITLIDTGATHSFMSEVFMHSISVEPTVMPLYFNIVLPSGDEICATNIIKACPIQVGFLIGIPIISCLQANKLLHKGCMGFLASVVDVRKESNLQLQDIDVVQDYLDVFSDDVPGLPPDREVEFVIDLIPGTAPISKAPYRMAPTEMKELKTQLQELLDKGFIRPSSSPWGAPVFFQELKAKLTSAPVLAIPEGPGDFVVYNDASKQGLEAVLNAAREGKANVVADALSRKSSSIAAMIKVYADNELQQLRQRDEEKGNLNFELNGEGIWTYRGRLCVPNQGTIRTDILINAHA